MSANSAIDRIGRSIVEVLAWAWRETAALLPDALAAAGATTRAQLITLDAAGAPASTAGAVKSWLGRWRYASKPGRDEAVILMDSSKVLMRSVRLSPLAARDPDAAIRLQAETLCPIRHEDAVMSIASSRPNPAGDGVMVDLAIARRADVEAAAGLAADRAARWRVAADFGSEGALGVFASGAPERPASPVLMALLAGLGVLTALTALDVRLARDADALAAQRDALLAEARADRAAAENLNTPEARAASYPRLTDVLREIGGPGDARIEVVIVDGRRIVIETVDGGVIEARAGRP